MKRTLLSCIYLFVFFSAIKSLQAQTTAPVIKWQYALGGTKDEEFRSMMLVPGGTISCGFGESIDGNVTGNKGKADYWIVRMDSSGNVLQEKTFGGTAKDRGRHINRARDHGYIITGYSESNNGDITGNHGSFDYWVISADSLLNIKWQKSLGGTLHDNAYYGYATKDGGFIISGYIRSGDGDITGYHGGDDIWIVKLNEFGEMEWQKALGGSDNEQSSSIIETYDGGFLVSAYTTSNDGDVSGNHGNNDVWLVKLNAEGDLMWQRCYGGSQEDAARVALQTLDRGYIVFGSVFSGDGDFSGNHGSSDFMAMKLDSAGNIIWQKLYGGSKYDYAYSGSITPENYYLLAGYTDSNDGDVTGHHGGSDMWVVAIGFEGEVFWEKTFGGSGTDISRDIYNPFPGIYYVAGFTTSTDGDVTGNHGGSDAWILKLCTEKKFYADTDGDGFGNPNIRVPACDAPAGYVADSTDCNDTMALINPSAVEFCNGIDDNCNGLTDINDSTLSINQTWYADADSDGFGDSTNILMSCLQPSGYVLDGNDCNDANVTINPAASELCNLIDENCNGEIDEGTGNTWYADHDSDGYGIYGDTITSCAKPPGYVANHDDCDDSNSNVHPSAADLCNGIDDNCNNNIDENALTVSVNPPGPISVCKSTPITLTATGENITGYQWYKNGIAVNGETNNTFTSTNGSSFYVTATNDFGCSGISNTVSVIRNPLPDATISILNGGNLNLCLGPVKLMASAGTNLAWQWYQGNSPISGATKRNFEPLAPGNYKVKVTNKETGCNKNSIPVKVVNECNKEYNNQESHHLEMNIYPNPAKDYLWIDLKRADEGQSNIKFNLFDAYGKLAFTNQMLTNDNHVIIPIALTDELPSGVYYVQLIADQKVMTQKLIIE